MVEKLGMVPISDRVVVRREDSEEKTSGGIVLPDAAKEKPRRGKVLAVGAGRMNKSGVREPMQVAVHDTVLFGAYAGNKVRHCDEDLLILMESDILAVIG
jgi:chaperonin GroES